MGIAMTAVPFIYKFIYRGGQFISMAEAKALEIPFWLKVTLTIKEAAAYSNIGINKIEELLKQPKCDFVLYVGNKKLVKRKEFEQYISRSLEN